MAKKIEVQIVGDADSFHKALGKATDSTSRFGRVAGTVGKAGFLAIGVGAGAAAVGLYKAVQAGSDWNETLNKSSVIFGQSSKDAVTWSQHMAEAGGISEQAALDAATTIGTFGKAAGVAKGELFGWSASLVNAASDLASFHNADPSQVLEDIRSGLAGEVEPLRKYGILMNDATLRTEALKLGLVKTTKDALAPNVKMLAAQKLILDKLGPAAGDFARTSGGLANQQRILKAELENVVTELGSALLPIVVKVAQVAIPLTIAVIKRLSQDIGAAIKWIGKFASHFQILGGKSESAGERIRNAWAIVTSFFRGSVMPIVQRLRGVFQDSMAAIAKVVQKDGPEIRRIFDRVGGAMKAIAQAAFPILKSTLVKGLPKAIDFSIKALDGLTHDLETLVNWLITAANAAETLKSKLDFLGSLNQGLLGDLGIDIHKGLLTQGGGKTSLLGGTLGTGGVGFGINRGPQDRRNPTQVNVFLDGKQIHSSVVNSDKNYRRQNGRSAFA